MRPTILVVALPLIAGGCSSTLPPDAPTPDGDLLSTARPIQYRTPLSGYVARQPVDPKSWKRQNELQSPSKGDAS
ncbi:hypothetical protein [Rhizobium rhizogenes]|jgi:hypothetical protein|uniref:Uncharacterized protein n=1 Tax=Rhizobium rhizogenes (strain K84 / ATCC BAA-868) TaxID=311403 RepID=B9JN97_RHIR8|nr:hypothetical protein [Rhizobium rhizogenes]ACM29028.1 conserved hypothetical protein [Rhizobium rhizogenes K84]MDJ1634253.1 hypothetical protein [Rhizobium rhizogenes]QRM40307.1 hypothetical protein F3X89_20895 [Rhizobium rhizogenes]TRB21788.1 hypothetical protein EXN70_18425 [Rhizobium rhizogenes]WEO68757.1 hypothetical protein G6L54_021185 [Rhizobium rhizogenes]